MEELMFHHWVKVLVYLYNHQNDSKDMTLWRMSKELNISSGATLHKIVKLLVKKGILKVERKGRNNKYLLTNKGIRIAEHLNKIGGEL